MFRKGITSLITRTGYLLPRSVFASHSSSCPAKGSGGGEHMGPPIRASASGKCRMSFIPEEWFTFFHVKTGVSGPYVFGLAVANYLLSKEIFVMEHEYYCGLSLGLIIIIVTSKFGKDIGAILDKEVDAVANEYESGRREEVATYNDIIKSSEKAVWMAEGQQSLMEAKKENVAMQLEAEYRERCMLVYRMVKGRMDYHYKRYYAEARVQQKWMIQWILNSVMKSITPEFERQALDTAIADLSAAANRA